MTLQVRLGIVFLFAALNWAGELVNVVVSGLMIEQNPFHSIFFITARKRACEFLVIIFLVGCKVVLKMLRQFKTFVAAIVSALVWSQ